MHSGLFFWIIDNPEHAIEILRKLDGTYENRSEVIAEFRLEETKEILAGAVGSKRRTQPTTS